MNPKYKFLAVATTLALSYGICLPCVACPSGGCPRSGGSMGTPNFKPTAAARLPRVTAIDGNRISVGKKTYLVNDTVDVTVDGKEASVSAIQPGMRVLVTNQVMDRSKDIYKATRIVARTP
jgi:hypothetical protein